jgi:hypothetical protein
MADNMDDNIKKAQAYKDALDAINKRIQNQDQLVGSLANEMGIAYSSFLSQTKKTQEERLKEIKLINDAKKSIEGQKSAISEAFNDVLKLDGAFKKSQSSANVFANALSSIDASNLTMEFSSIEEVQARINDLKSQEVDLTKEQLSELQEIEKLEEKFQKDMRDFHKDNQVAFEDWLENNEQIQEILDDLPLDSIEDKMKLIEDLRNGELHAAEQILATDKLDEASKANLLGLTQQMQDSQESLNELQAEASNQMKTETSIRKNMWNMVKQNSGNAFKAIWDNMKQTNQAFKDAQRDFGMIFDESNYSQMADLTSKAAEFNMSVKDTVEMMGQLGEELATINTSYLASATENFVAIQKATGISSGEITTIAGEMMRAGQSAEDVESYMEGANKMAKLYGVNSKKALGAIARNMDKMRQMGFTGGEDSLTKMVMTAERLRMNVDEIFDVAKRARTIEGAMDMAAELQLAGGSFAQINPMDLLSAARKGPEELQKILTQMGGDIGSWNEETGEFQFDPVDVDRLQIVADATGQSMDSIQKMIQKNAEDAKKADFMPDLALGEVMGPDGKPLDQDMMNNMLKDSVDIDGNIIEGSMLDKAGITDIKDLTSEQANSIIQDHVNKQASLEEQARQNQSFNDSITAFKDAIMNLFVVFQPFIDILTEFIQGINQMGPVAKGLVAALVGFVMIAPKLAMAMQAFKGLGGGIKGMLGGGKGGGGLGGAMKQGMGGAEQSAGSGLDGKAGEAQKGFFTKLAEGIKKFGEVSIKDILKFGLALGIIGLAITGFMYALSMTGDPSLSQFVGAAASLLILGGAMFMLSKIKVDTKSLLKMSLAMAIVGAALIPFAYAAQMMIGVDWLSVLAGVGILALIMAGLVLIGIMLTGPQIIALLIAAAALAIVGLALLAFGFAMVQFATATQMMQGMSFDWMYELAFAMILAGPLLLLGGIMLGLAAPFLFIGALALYPLVELAERASAVDWNAFSMMGDALMGLVPSLLAFGFAGLMFFNPILMLGMLAMIGTLAGLAVVMLPLAESLPAAAEGLNSMAEGLERLMEAANSLDFEKLEALRSLSWSMAIAGIGGGIMGDSINKIAEALAKLAKIGDGGGSGGGNKKIEINLKLNGRDLQSIIVDDTEIVS